MSDKDTIYRQDAIDAADRADYTGLAVEDVKKVTDEVVKEIKKLPSAQPEEAIPAAWLEEQAKWFESMDNAFAKIEASNIRVMIKKWRMKKDERFD